MFGLFKSRPAVPEPAVTPEDKQWVEESVLWFIKAFGTQHLRPEPFILPDQITSLQTDLRERENLHKLLKELCAIWQLDPETIIIKVFDDILSKQWTEMMPTGTGTIEVGLYYEEYTADRQRFIVNLASSILTNPPFAAYVLTHELGHVKLLGDKYLTPERPDLEPLTDLASIFFGFGLISANTSVSEVNNWIRRNGYLPPNVIAYANALLCYTLGSDGNSYVNLFNTNTRELFDKNYYFLKTTGDTSLTDEVLANAEKQYELGSIMEKAFSEHRYQDAEKASKELLTLCPDELYIYNNLGYALLQQRKYKDAVAVFTMVIDKDPYYDYPFSNRGYCRLQDGDMDNGYVDLKCAYDMNPNNSYAVRNLGVYYLLSGDHQKALEHFQHAQKMDPQTEMINFYLSQAHKKLGNMVKANEYAFESEKLKEHNDSVFEPVVPIQAV